MGHRSSEIGIAHQVQVEVQNLSEGLRIDQTPFPFGEFVEQLFHQEGAHHTHRADDVFLVQTDANVAKTDTVSILGVSLVVNATEQATPPDLQRGFQAPDLCLAACEDAARIRVVGNLGVKPFRHFGEVLFHAWPELFEHSGIGIEQMEIPLHFLDKALRAESLGVGSRHPGHDITLSNRGGKRVLALLTSAMATGRTG